MTITERACRRSRARPCGVPPDPPTPQGRPLYNVTALLMGDPAARDAREPTEDERRIICITDGRTVRRNAIVASMPWLARIMRGQRVTGLTSEQCHSARDHLARRGIKARVRSTKVDGRPVYSLRVL